MNGQNIGYIRVSSITQNGTRQLEGHELDKVFEEKISAKDKNRPELEKCIEFLREGDTLHVHSIDRLARNLRDLEEIVEALNSKGVFIHFHKEGLLFKGKEDPIQKLMFQMMGAFAEFERSLINERQREGIALAKKAGKYKGRKKALSLDQVNEIKERVAKGEKKTALAKEYGISRQTLYASTQE